MRGRKCGWVCGVLAALVTLAVLFGAQELFTKYAIARPMDRMMGQIDEIESFQITLPDEAGSGRGKAEIKLEHVKNLQELYGRIVSVLDKYGGAKKYDIILTDNRNTQLNDFYYQIHYYIEEAQDKSNFPAMAEKIQKKAVETGIRSKIYVDANYIYLQAEVNTENILAENRMYIVLPRKKNAEER